MKMNKLSLIVSLLIGFLYIGNIAYSQVGINNSIPNQYSVMDMKSTKMGVLIPRMNTTSRLSITTDCAPNCPNGLLVYDTEKKSFFYYFNSKWFLINPFTAPDNSQGVAEDMYTNDAVVSNVGLGTRPSSAYKLDVNGKYLVSDSSTYDDSLVVTNGVHVKSGNTIVSSGDIVVKNNNLLAPNSHLYASSFSSNVTDINVNGPVPAGGIVIWKGNAASVPTGWVVCDGTNGTPDLRERFVVGSGDNPSVTGGSINQGATGGDRTITLTTSQLPSHQHDGSTNLAGNHEHLFYGYRTPEDYDCAGCHNDKQSKSRGKYNNDPLDYSGEPSGNHSHTITINNNGSDNAHENRPLFMSLIYIMKL